MLTECVDAVQILFFLVFLLFWPGFVLQNIFVSSKNILEAFIYSTAFGIAFLALVCPVLDILWNVSYMSVSCSVILLSAFLLIKRPRKLIPPHKWEVILLFLILGYGFLLRSSTLLDALPEGQDAWRHLSFMHYIRQTNALPRYLPWMEPEMRVTARMYPLGSHCIGALLSQPFPDMPFTLLKAFFILVGTGSVLSLYIVVAPLMKREEAFLSAFLTAVFVPHMIMTTEITAEALSIFLYPLIPYLFYKKNVTASGILLGALALIHHLSAFAAVTTLLAIALVFSVQQKSVKYSVSFFWVSVIALAVSAPWWALQPMPDLTTTLEAEMVFNELPETFLNPYVEMVSPLFIIFSMIGFFVLLKERKEHYVFLIGWSTVLFILSQYLIPVQFSSHRFLGFFVFPCSVLVSLGLLKTRDYVRKPFFVAILLILFIGYPPHFWPATGEQNLRANEWIQDSTLDSLFYVYDHYYTFIYPLSHRKIYWIVNFDEPFAYEYEPAYFYDDASWVPHDPSRFGRFDKLYSCSGVVVFRIT